MDRNWMRQRLDIFETVATEYLSLKGPTVGRTLLSSGREGNHPKAGPLRAELVTAEPTIKKILHCLDPGLSKDLSLDQTGGVKLARDQVRRGLGILNDMDKWATKLVPDAPSLPADQFHPWVWDAARTLWESKHFREAVHAAATSINAHLQTKLGRRDLSDAKLVQEALTDKAPEPGKPRLRVPGDHADPSVQSCQRGAMNLGAGAYFALRNPAAHTVGDLPEQEALEQLAVFSVLARRIDECQVVT